MDDMGDTVMEDEPLERANLALPDIERDRVAHAGEPRFKVILEMHLPAIVS